MAVNGNFAYVADGDSGLQVIDVSNPAAPQARGNYDTPGWATDIDLSGNYAFVADFDFGVRVIDITSPDAPTSPGYFETSGYAYAVAVSGGTAYIADASDGLRIADVSNPAAPYELGYFLTDGWAADVAVNGNYAYLADGAGGLRIIDVSNPSSPTEAGVFNQNSYVTTVTVAGNLAYIFDNVNGMLILDVTNPASPVQVGSYNPAAGVNDIAIDGNYAYLAADIYGVGAGFQVVDISDPSSPFEAGYYYTGDHARGVAVSNGFAYVGANMEGLDILRYDIPTIAMAVTMTPHNPPVVINAGGGDFYYDVAIENLTNQAIVADAVLEAVLPNSATYHVLTKAGITFPANTVIPRSNLVQHVPAGAPAGSYIYRLNIVDSSGAILASDDFPFEKIAPTLASGDGGAWTLKGWRDEDRTPLAETSPCVLEPASPNPFNPRTSLRFDLRDGGRVTLQIYDLQGRVIRSLITGEYLASGAHTITWRGDDDSGQSVAGGVYLYRLQVGNTSATGRMTMIK